METTKVKLLQEHSIGTWIAEWSSHSTLEHRYDTPWAMSLSLGDIKLFFGPKHNI